MSGVRKCHLENLKEQKDLWSYEKEAEAYYYLMVIQKQKNKRLQ